MSYEQYQAIGAVLSGIASGGTAYFGIKLLIKHGKEECDKRFQAFREGMRIGEREKDPQ